jgi:predicted transcriptional regulator
MRRPAPPRDIPPPLELECLKALWQLGHGSVRDVLDAVRNRKLAYTTVMTVLDRLEKRSAVSRQKQGRAFIYEPKLTREVLRQFAVKDLVDVFFDGSEQALLEHLRRSAARETRETGAVREGGGMEPALL